MEEADRVAKRIAVIDHGKIIASGTPKELKEKNKAASLEEAFLSLTGKTIREEAVASLDHMRNMSRMLRR